MYLRKQRSRRAEVLYEDFNPQESGPIAIGAPDQRLSTAHERIAMSRAIEQLPPGYRLVFVLHDIEGYEHTEIAEMLGCSVGNTKSQLHKARMKMRTLLMGTAKQSQNHSQAKLAA
jgi:RNA polymerase sigma-70 factor (ECF subfamily)